MPPAPCKGAAEKCSKGLPIARPDESRSRYRRTRMPARRRRSSRRMTRLVGVVCRSKNGNRRQNARDLSSVQKHACNSPVRHAGTSGGGRERAASTRRGWSFGSRCRPASSPAAPGLTTEASSYVEGHPNFQSCCRACSQSWAADDSAGIRPRLRPEVLKSIASQGRPRACARPSPPVYRFTSVGVKSTRQRHEAESCRNTVSSQ